MPLLVNTQKDILVAISPQRNFWPELSEIFMQNLNGYYWL